MAVSSELQDPSFNVIDIIMNYCIIALLITIVLFNSIFLLAYLMLGKPQNQMVKSICLLNQSLSDLSIIVPLIMQLVITDKIWRYVYPIALYTIYIRIGSLIINTLHSFIVVNVPKDHFKLITRYRLYFAIIVSWTISVIPAVKCSVILTDHIIFKDNILWYYTVVESGVIFIIAFVIIFVILLKSFKVKKASAESCVEVKEDAKEKEQLETTVEYKSNEERRLVKMMSFIDLFHAFTLIPYMVGGIIVLIVPGQANYILSITYLVYASSAVINPLLTMIYNNEFLDVLKIGCWSSTPITITDL